jgi:phosphohistidine phosphatase
MQLLVVRHAPAGDKVEFAASGRPDGERPLTDEGVRKMRAVASGLGRLVDRLDLVATSPLRRARETAEILLAAYDSPPLETVEALAPGSPPAALMPWLEHQASSATVAVVGHEPHLSGLVSWLVAGSARPWLELSKGGACLLDVERPAARGAVLRWLIEARILRRLRR